MLASALLGISGQTWWGRSGDVAELWAGLNLNVTWTVGFAFAVSSGGPPLATFALIAFSILFAQGIYWRTRIRSRP